MCWPCTPPPMRLTASSSMRWMRCAPSWPGGCGGARVGTRAALPAVAPPAFDSGLPPLRAAARSRCLPRLTPLPTILAAGARAASSALCWWCPTTAACRRRWGCPTPTFPLQPAATPCSQGCWRGGSSRCDPMQRGWQLARLPGGACLLAQQLLRGAGSTCRAEPRQQQACWANRASASRTAGGAAAPRAQPRPPAIHQHQHGGLGGDRAGQPCQPLTQPRQQRRQHPWQPGQQRRQQRLGAGQQADAGAGGGGSQIRGGSPGQAGCAARSQGGAGVGQHTARKRGADTGASQRQRTADAGQLVTI